MFSEYHGEGVHGGGTQLFDLKSDPRECVNLSGEDCLKEIEDAMRSRLLERFDPEEIAARVRRGQKASRYISRAMETEPRTHWDYAPDYPAHLRYFRR